MDLKEIGLYVFNGVNTITMMVILKTDIGLYGILQAARGQARIPSLEDIHELTFLAAKDGWLAKIEY